MKKSFGALVTSINRCVPVLSITLLGFAALLSVVGHAGVGRGARVDRQLLVR